MVAGTALLDLTEVMSLRRNRNIRLTARATAKQEQRKTQRD